MNNKFLPMEREASCGVGGDAIAEFLLGVLEAFEVGPVRSTKKSGKFFFPTI